MKLLVLGLDCAAPEILLQYEELPTIRRLMEQGCYGSLESVIPPITVPAWMCMATSRDPGSLGVYGFRNRADHSYAGLTIANAQSVRGFTIWDQIATEGGRAIVMGVPPNFPPRKVNGISVGCFLTPDTTSHVFTHPAGAGETITRLAGGEYPVDVKGFRTDDKAWLKDRVFELSRTQWRVLRHLLRTEPWDYGQFVDIGLDRVQHGFWRHHDPRHVQHDPGGPFADVVRAYYRHLDEEIAAVLELLSDDTTVLILSDHGARPLDGGFCVNEWLIREGFLTLRAHPQHPTPFDQLDVDWSRTRAWSEGGYYARVYLNVRGREPQGTVNPAAYESVRSDLAARLEATVDPSGRPLGTVVHRPEDAYREVHGVPPDLIAFFGNLAWRSVGRVGYGALHVQENDTGPDDCNHAQLGAFVLAGPAVQALGPVRGARLIDMAPTLLALGGYDVPPSMQGRTLDVGDGRAHAAPNPVASADAEAEVRRHLSGLGYLG